MSVINITGLGKNYGMVPATRDVTFSVDEGEIVAIIGSSGCGKTTTLRMIAGLESVSFGTIAIDGKVVAEEGKPGVPTEHRNIGMVFQSYALWPHLSVFDNVAYPLNLRKVPSKEIRRRVLETLALVGLESLDQRYPNELSGGQQQRVALARCIVAEPRVLLFDEPLSNLDAKRREQMRGEIRTLIKRINGTAIYITHDQMEAMTIADRIVCMNMGHVEQIGAPADLYERPVNKFVAGFIGDCDFLNCEVDAASRNAILSNGIRVPVGHINKPDLSGPATLCLRPDRLEVIAPRADPAVLPAEIVKKIYMGPVTEYTLRIGSEEIRVRDRDHNHPLGSAGVRIHEGGAMALFDQ